MHSTYGMRCALVLAVSATLAGCVVGDEDDRGPELVDEPAPDRGDVAEGHYTIKEATVTTNRTNWDLDGTPPDLYLKVWINDKKVLDTWNDRQQNEWSQGAYTAQWVGNFGDFPLGKPSTVYAEAYDEDNNWPDGDVHSCWTGASPDMFDDIPGLGVEAQVYCTDARSAIILVLAPLQ